MVKRDPDDLISALSKNLKSQDSPVLRITFKRGALWQPEFAKAHAKKAKIQINKKLVSQNAQQQDKQYPLLVRYKQNRKQQNVRLNAVAKIGHNQSFIESMLSVFRVNFFKKKQQIKAVVSKGISKPDPQSKSSSKKIVKKQRNNERKQKLKAIKRQTKKQANKPKKMLTQQK